MSSNNGGPRDDGNESLNRHEEARERISESEIIERRAEREEEREKTLSASAGCREGDSDCYPWQRGGGRDRRHVWRGGREHLARRNR